MFSPPTSCLGAQRVGGCLRMVTPEGTEEGHGTHSPGIVEHLPTKSLWLGHPTPRWERPVACTRPQGAAALLKLK